VRFAFVILLAAGAATAGPAAEPAQTGRAGWWSGTLEGAFAEAREREAMVVLDAWADWCHWCRLYEEQVFTEARVAAELADGIVPIRLEVDERRGIGTGVAKTYGIRSLPVILFLDGKGPVVHRIDRYYEPDEFLEQIAYARRAAVPLETLEARAAADGTAESLFLLAQRLRALERGDEAAALLRRVLEADAEGESDFADDALMLLAADRQAEGKPEEALTLLERLTTTLAVGDRTREAFYTRLELLGQLGRSAELLSVYRLMAERLGDDPRVLSDYAWHLSQLGTSLEEAEAAARRAVSLAPEDADPLDTLAQVLYRRGRLDEAVDTIERAVALDPGNPDYRERRLDYVRALRAELTGRGGGPGG
jgi:tetratricopeptide (TPR) repeat protein